MQHPHNIRAMENIARTGGVYDLALERRYVKHLVPRDRIASCLAFGLDDNPRTKVQNCAHRGFPVSNIR